MYPVTPASLPPCTLQFDTLLGSLTVYEMLLVGTAPAGPTWCTCLPYPIGQ